VVVAFGNGPQVRCSVQPFCDCHVSPIVKKVGYLSTQQGASFDLDVVDAETQGMIGYELEQELRNVLPHSTNVAALLTQVEVDPKDPAFLNPTKVFFIWFFFSFL
jgi:carbamate kinase